MSIVDVNDWEDPDDTEPKPPFRPASQVLLQHVDEYAEPDVEAGVQTSAHSSGRNRNSVDPWGTVWTSADINNPSFGGRHVD